jgi:hypothetical protein
MAPDGQNPTPPNNPNPTPPPAPPAGPTPPPAEQTPPSTPPPVNPGGDPGGQPNPNPLNPNEQKPAGPGGFASSKNMKLILIGVGALAALAVLMSIAVAMF